MLREKNEYEFALAIYQPHMEHQAQLAVSPRLALLGVYRHMVTAV